MKKDDVIQLSVEDNYVVFRDHPRTKVPIRKGSGFIGMDNGILTLRYTLLKLREKPKKEKA